MEEQDVKSYGQVSLPIPDERERDRNFHLGGRSFYFFDFDDNIVHLQTKILIFNKSTGEEHAVPTSDFPVVSKSVGVKGGPFENWELREDPLTGSFRNFR